MTEHNYKDFYPDGSVKSEVYVKDGEFHRENGPAYISYYQRGGVEVEKWLLHGWFHRIVFPAILRYSITEKLENYQYFSNRQNITDRVVQYLKENEIDNPFDISPENQLILKLKFW